MSNKRKFERYDNPTGLFNITTDKKNWYEIGLVDVSAGGMKFTSPASFDVDDSIHAVLMIRNKLKDNILNLDGIVKRRDEAEAGVNSYAVEFTNLKDSQITNLSEIMFFVK
jgi:c-di-GMP-binding flagellar brake protein YcgR